MISHQMQFFNAVNLGATARITDKTIQLVVLPLFHTGGMNCYANPILHNGGQIVLMKEFDPGKSLEIINNPEHGITHFFAVPAPFQFMMQHPNFETTDFSRIEGAGVGGAPCAEIIIETWQNKGVELWQGWGMTETSPGGIGLSGDDAARKIGSAGKPLLHTEVKIVDSVISSEYVNVTKIESSLSSISTNTGLAFKDAIVSAVDIKVNGEVIISSPG